MARLQDLETTDPITKGDHEEIEFVLNKPDGSPRNLSGYTVLFGAKFDLSDAVVNMPKSSANVGEIEITNAVSGVGKVLIEKEDTDFITYEATLIAALVAVDSQGREATTRFKLPVELGVVDD